MKVISNITTLIRKQVRKNGFDIIRFKEDNRSNLAKAFSALAFFKSGDQYQATDPDDERSFFYFVCENVRHVKSQCFQDLFVLYELNKKENGFFVEFGATNGVNLSNTYFLEKYYHWTGILAEPAQSWHNTLQNNRKCKIDTHCVWSKSGEKLEFNEASVGEISTLAQFSHNDPFQEYRNQGKNYLVETISLNDLLEKHQAPQQIDYMSIDTEGSEYDILSTFDFKKYDVKIMTIEHSSVEEQNKILELMTKQGYVRKFPHLSAMDDWFIKEK